jgi:putative ABC transport system permease protein
MGFDPLNSVFDMPEAEPMFDRLRQPDAVFFDEGSKPEYGTFQEAIKRGEKCEAEVSGHKVEIRGGFRLGISFASDGNLITSEDGFVRLMPSRQKGIIDIGMIRLKPGADARATQAKLMAIVPAGIQVMTRAEFMKTEMNYWSERTPIGFVFNMGTFVGFLVGSVIVYQILYTDVTDHLGEYATLKAMGYGDRYLCGVVMMEGLILAIVGFIPGWIFSTAMGILTRKITLLPAYMTWERTTLVLALTIVMCVGSGVLAMRKVRLADPADIF